MTRVELPELPRGRLAHPESAAVRRPRGLGTTATRTRRPDSAGKPPPRPKKVRRLKETSGSDLSIGGAGWLLALKRRLGQGRAESAARPDAPCPGPADPRSPQEAATTTEILARGRRHRRRVRPHRRDPTTPAVHSPTTNPGFLPSRSSTTPNSYGPSPWSPGQRPAWSGSHTPTQPSVCARTPSYTNTAHPTGVTA